MFNKIWLLIYIFTAGELDAWMNDEAYIPNNEQKKIKGAASRNRRGSVTGVAGYTPVFQTSGQISDRLANEFNNIITNESAKERARKASREIIKERNDTSGGGKVNEFPIIYNFLTF